MKKKEKEKRVHHPFLRSMYLLISISLLFLLGFNGGEGGEVVGEREGREGVGCEKYLLENECSSYVDVTAADEEEQQRR